MEKNIKLSIIIPCYNCEKTLVEAVNSCYNQNIGEDFEIILVDDCSTDNTRKVMESLYLKDSRIKLFHHSKNQGGGATRNTAVSNAIGDVIFCLDSDDLLPNETLLKMYEYLSSKNCDGVTIHKSIKFIANNTKNIDRIDISPYSDQKIPFSSLVSRTKEFCPIYVNFMYTKNAFNKISGYPTTHGYDTQGFAWKFMCAGLNIYTCPDSEYLHRINYNRSYFVREYDAGKINYNWRSIFLENYFVFSEKTLEFICNFKCLDFTKSIYNELIKRDDIFKIDLKDDLLKKHTPRKFKISEPVYINRNSITGYYLRIRRKIIELIKKI